MILGIDTGGTYTDGVLLDSKQRVIAKAKALTTHQDLAIGIRNCINNLQERDWQQIRLVSLSTTLATNAVVEGRGCEAGLLLIGNELPGVLPTQNYAVLQGGHDISGNPLADLDIREIRAALTKFQGNVDAMAISGYLSVRNPEHELRVREIVDEILGVPVVCAHELTSSLGFRERTVTAVLNAKLIPVIKELMASVKAVLREFNIQARLMIVKGDGTLMTEEGAMDKPIETILSGPAASIVGATSLTGADKAIILDMGGTTTDIAVLKDGVPKVNPEGATVGGWLTRVRAADIVTCGLGGDSYIKIDSKGRLSVGPQRVWPLAIAADKYPYLIQELQDQMEAVWTVPFAQPTDSYIFLKDKSPLILSEVELSALKTLKSGAHTHLSLAKQLGIEPYFLNLQRLVEFGMLVKASLTPTDLLHVQGSYTPGNVNASKLGIEIMAHRLGVSSEEFIKLALNQVTENLCLALFDSMLNHNETSPNIKQNLKAEIFLDKIFDPCSEEPFNLAVQVNYPLIAIGAPVKDYLPKAAEKLRCKLMIPEHSEVANAVGAASGKLIETMDALIRPNAGGGFILHSPWERKVFENLTEAKEYARQQFEQEAKRSAEKAGVVYYDLTVDFQDQYLKTNTSQTNDLYLDTKVQATILGRPNWL
ncbi:hydantoinase/oxoprolinase family protein [Desulfosporosinus youngiae]|uniref:N-methylhydantoinase A/acetone carboxylase, beta subunit n=1 Tax=Desulfosporosinus youngiae DSM 17734 TaxID=768710 RepID=H5XWN7_9FIRM|nr:hydantoinase/oxoprolinase family protein [Desulfosporosinus youngiae]EHQ90545.1 N-methylhydantoinase A/acetone carboxylase, beta subunit [Desulfosporosinus youngiae DSM 17734]